MSNYPNIKNPKPNTPWGLADCRTQWDRGLYRVSTPGHGGFLISKGLADKILTWPAINRSQPWKGYYAYEEDLAYAVLIWEFLSKGLYPELTAQYDKDTLWKVLSRWHPKYLQSLGVAPETEALAQYEAQRARDIARDAKSPDLIVSALRNAQDAALTDVFTADGKKHIVGGYDCSNPWLSKCQIVESPVEKFNNVAYYN